MENIYLIHNPKGVKDDVKKKKIIIIKELRKFHIFKNYTYSQTLSGF